MASKDYKGVYEVGADYGDKSLQWGDDGAYLAEQEERSLLPKPRSPEPQRQPEAPKPQAARQPTYEEMLAYLQRNAGQDINRDGPSVVEQLKAERTQSDQEKYEQMRQKADQMLSQMRAQSQAPTAVESMGSDRPMQLQWLDEPLDSDESQ